MRAIRRLPHFQATYSAISLFSPNGQYQTSAIPFFNDVLGQTAIPGSGGTDALSDTNKAPEKYYRIGVQLP